MQMQPLCGRRALSRILVQGCVAAEGLMGADTGIRLGEERMVLR